MAISVPEQGRLRHPISYFRTELYATPAYRSDTPWCIRAVNGDCHLSDSLGVWAAPAVPGMIGATHKPREGISMKTKVTPIIVAAALLAGTARTVAGNRRQR